MKNKRRLGIIHAYPSRWLVDALTEAGWQIVLIGDLPVDLFAGQAQVITVPLWNEAAVIDAVCQHHQQQPFAALLPVYEGSTMLTARISAMLGLPGYGEAAALASRNKYLSYLMWQGQGIPVPRTVPLLRRADDWALIEQEFAGDAVIKLADSMNSQGVIRIRNAQEFAAASEVLHKMLQQSHNISLQDNRNRFAYGRSAVSLIAQEFCPGEEVGVDLVIHGRQSHVLGLFQKAPAAGPCFAETLSVWPSSLGSEMEQELGQLAIRAARALGLQQGAAHVEIRIGADGPKVLEAGLRPGGAYTVKASEILTGINQYTWLADALCGNAVPTPGTAHGAILYGGIVYTQTGVLKQIHGSEIFSDIPGLIDVQILNQPGDRVYALPRSAQPHFCYYLIQAETRERALAIHQRIQNRIKLDIDPIGEFT
ncbi:MAG: hypothetical protein RL748_2799 [Pseudomonadota bacterium]|jgi:biotin carboxylase